MATSTIRVPDDLWDDVKAAAKQDERSINGEVIWLLRAALDAVTRTRVSTSVPLAAQDNR